eukprot:scaffold12929_cov21-Tisochrysis_lutea.AAC.5
MQHPFTGREREARVTQLCLPMRAAELKQKIGALSPGRPWHAALWTPAAAAAHQALHPVLPAAPAEWHSAPARPHHAPLPHAAWTAGRRSDPGARPLGSQGPPACVHVCVRVCVCERERERESKPSGKCVSAGDLMQRIQLACIQVVRAVRGVPCQLPPTTQSQVPHSPREAAAANATRHGDRPCQPAVN